MWMRLAAGYMVQAVAEQYLVFQAKRPEILREAFSWGFDEESTAVEGTDEFIVNVMFFDEEAEAPNARWEDVRQEHINAVGSGTEVETRMKPTN